MCPSVAHRHRHIGHRHRTPRPAVTRLRALTFGTLAGNPSTQRALAADIGPLQFLRTSLQDGMTPAGNWWFWKSNSPQRVDILRCCTQRPPAAHCPLAATRWFSPTPIHAAARTLLRDRSNRSDKALICCLREFWLPTPPNRPSRMPSAMLQTVAGGACSRTSTKGRFYSRSFVQHSCLPYAGSYGVVRWRYRRVIAMLRARRGNHRPRQAVLFDAVGSVAPFVWDGRIWIRARPAVSRQNEQTTSPVSAWSPPFCCWRPAAIPYRSRFLSLAKGWLQRCTDQKLVATPTQTVAKSLLALDVLADGGPGRPCPGVHVDVRGPDRLVHQRPGGASQSASVQPDRPLRVGNNENKLAGTSDGATFLYTRQDAAQFSATSGPRWTRTGCPERRSTGGRTVGANPTWRFPKLSRLFRRVAMDRRWRAGMDHVNHNVPISREVLFPWTTPWGLARITDAAPPSTRRTSFAPPRACTRSPKLLRRCPRHPPFCTYPRVSVPPPACQRPESPVRTQMEDINTVLTRRARQPQPRLRQHHAQARSIPPVPLRLHAAAHAPLSKRSRSPTLPTCKAGQHKACQMIESRSMAVLANFFTAAPATSAKRVCVQRPALSLSRRLPRCRSLFPIPHTQTSVRSRCPTVAPVQRHRTTLSV